MYRSVWLLLPCSLVGGAFGAPVPSQQDVKKLVAKLGDPDEDVRKASSAALKDRVDALPWLRRAARSHDMDTARRAANLLAPHERKRQEAVAGAIDACVRDNCADLFTEWHHYWKPEKSEDLWPVVPRLGKAAIELFGKRCKPGENWLDQGIGVNMAENKPRYLDGPLPRPLGAGAWHVRTDRLDSPRWSVVAASVSGPINASWLLGGYFCNLGPTSASKIQFSCLLCDGEVTGPFNQAHEIQYGTDTLRSFVACRGNLRVGSNAIGCILAVDGDIDLTQASTIKDCLIRASGEIHLPESASNQPVNCDIKAHAKDATAPYKFFELADVGLRLADDEEGLVVRALKPGTPFGDCGLAKGDVILAIDDAPAGSSEEFRKVVRRALVRQGDCLLTVERTGKKTDIPVFLPLTK